MGGVSNNVKIMAMKKLFGSMTTGKFTLHPKDSTLARFRFNMADYPKYGLFTDDTVKEDEYVKEAISRMPSEMQNQRMFRINRALLLSNQKIVLPKEEWVTVETNEEYLEPYLAQVLKESVEKKEWY